MPAGAGGGGTAALTAGLTRDTLAALHAAQAGGQPPFLIVPPSEPSSSSLRSVGTEPLPQVRACCSFGWRAVVSRQPVCPATSCPGASTQVTVDCPSPQHPRHLRSGRTCLPAPAARSLMPSSTAWPAGHHCLRRRACGHRAASAAPVQPAPQPGVQQQIQQEQQEQMVPGVPPLALRLMGSQAPRQRRQQGGRQAHRRQLEGSLA